MPSFGLMLAHRLRRWPNIKPALGQRLVMGGYSRGCWEWCCCVISNHKKILFSEIIVFPIVVATATKQATYETLKATLVRHKIIKNRYFYNASFDNVSFKFWVVVATQQVYRKPRLSVIAVFLISDMLL